MRIELHLDGEYVAKFPVTNRLKFGDTEQGEHAGKINRSEILRRIKEEIAATNKRLSIEIKNADKVEWFEVHDPRPEIGKHEMELFDAMVSAFA